jgi:hypothetical protein
MVAAESEQRLGVPFPIAKAWLWPDGYENRKKKRRERAQARRVA